MCSESYEEWLSIYNDEIKSVWEEERTDLRKLSMIYCAFQKELDRIKSTLCDQFGEVRQALKKKECLEKCKKFAGLAQSERFDDIVTVNKENETPELVPLAQLDLNETKNEDIFIESHNTGAFFKDLSPSPQPDKNKSSRSPILRKHSFVKAKKRCSSPSVLYPIITHKISKTPKFEQKTPKICDDSNIMECSIIEDTPDFKIGKRSKKSRRKKPAFNKSKQGTTLTQLFFQPKKAKHVDSNLPSMTMTEMINFINESSGSETEAELDQSDETVDNLELAKPIENIPQSSAQSIKKDKKPEKEDSPEVIYEEVVRGNARKKLKGWSCQECQHYYEGLDLSPEELQKKKDACSKHRFKFKPREETYDGFWDLTFGPTPQTQDSDKSIVLNYKKP